MGGVQQATSSRRIDVAFAPFNSVWLIITDSGLNFLAVRSSLSQTSICAVEFMLVQLQAGLRKSTHNAETGKEAMR
jgi:hypothetical protein